MKLLLALLLISQPPNPLTPQQAQELKRVEASLLAPCCYSQPVGQHMSAAAEQMRGEIYVMVTSGKSEGEILEHYKAEYGERILVVPDGRTGQVLFALPIVAGCACLALFLFFLRGMLKRKARDMAGLAARTSDPAYKLFRARIQKETGDDL